MDKRTERKNMIFFGLGTIGRDMFFTMVSMYLLVFVTEVLTVTDEMLALITAVLLILRIFDAVNDPVMGVLVDNTRGKLGKFKPGIIIGGVTGAVTMLMMFTDLGLKGVPYVVVFGLSYLLWDLFYGLNDIAYWSMLPALTTDQKQREKIGSFARICANIGLFSCVVGIIPLTNALGDAVGSLKLGWMIFAIAIIVLMLSFQLFTVFGVKEPKGYFKEEDKTSLREMFGIIFKNDQLLWVAISMSLFMIGYTTTANFGVHYFKYAYGNEDMYSIFALVLGLSQLTALAVFPLFSKKFNRKSLYTLGTVLVVIGYLCFFFLPMKMTFIAIAGVLLFVGQAFIQILMLMFLTDTIEYGQLKLGKRNESVTLSVQPFINKIGAAIANGILGLTLIVSGINSAKVAGDVTPEGILKLKISMMIIPLAAIILGYIIYLWKFKIDEKEYESILVKLKERGDIQS